MATASTTTVTGIADKPDLRTPDCGQPKGRRKLDFSESQRFKGKYFFLDLDGYRKARELAAELTARGASVEKFLDKRVRYLITNKSRNAIDQAKTNVSSNPATPSTGGLSQVFSPCSTNQSPHLVDKKVSPQPYYYTRSQKMLDMVKNKSSGKTDILTMAARWHCKIIHVEAVEKELKKLKPLTKKKTVEYKKPTPKYIKKLRTPFFKVEDKSRQFRPIIYEPAVWPLPNSYCSTKLSPFDVKNHQSEKSTNSGSSDGAKSDSEGDEEAIEEEMMACDKRPGFCEPCSVRYDNLKIHLSSEMHQQYAGNESNFAKLDELISQCTSLSDFLAESRKQLRSSRTPDFDIACSPSTMSPKIKQPQLTLKKIASPLPLTPLAKRIQVDRSSPELEDRNAKRAKMI